MTAVEIDTAGRRLKRALMERMLGAELSRHLGYPPLESVHARVRKVIKTRGHFPTDEAATKLVWLALRNIMADWSRPAHHWRAALNQFAILYEDRFTKVLV